MYQLDSIISSPIDVPLVDNPFIEATIVDSMGTPFGNVTYMHRDFAAMLLQLLNGQPAVREGLQAAQRLVNEALPKFNWGDSFLDADTITILNTASIKIEEANLALPQ